MAEVDEKCFMSVSLCNYSKCRDNSDTICNIIINIYKNQYRIIWLMKY